MLLRVFCLENEVEIRFGYIEWAVYPNRVGGDSRSLPHHLVPCIFP
jgi:hypothetical protein